MAAADHDPPTSKTLDPGSFVTEFLGKLGPRRRHIAFMLGSGASKAAGLPDVDGLATEVGGILAAEEDLREAYQRLSSDRNIEQVLTRARSIASLLEGTTETVDGLSAATAQRLNKAICSAINTVVSRDPDTLDLHRSFAGWLGRADHDSPIEVFTLNYDLLIERGLEEAGVPYFDGFVGAFDGAFRPDLIDAPWGRIPERLSVPNGWVRLWKLHGSISWKVAEGDHRIRRAGRTYNPARESLAIYPSAEKYEESRRVPFVTLFDRLRKSLEIPESITVTCGYSFGDDHINEALFDAAERLPRSEIFALFIGSIPEIVAARAATIPNITAVGASTAIVGTESRSWNQPQEQALTWNDGAFCLGAFQVLTELLRGARPEQANEPG